jgi:hypothetical protein
MQTHLNPELFTLENNMLFLNIMKAIWKGNLPPCTYLHPVKLYTAIKKTLQLLKSPLFEVDIPNRKVSDG